MYTEGKGVVAPAREKKTWNLRYVIVIELSESSSICNHTSDKQILDIGEAGIRFVNHEFLEFDVKMSCYQ